MSVEAKIVAVIVSLIAPVQAVCGEQDLLEPLRPYVSKVVKSLDEIPEHRKPVLNQTARFISGQLAAGKEAKLTFICTHNSRRSQLSQVWAQTAADYFGISGVITASGGTESTACNIRTVRALRRAGFSVVQSTQGTNPVYLVQYSEEKPPLRAYSKVYNAEGNPLEAFAALMCCSDADRKCPVVHGASARMSLHYVDPKVADNTPQEASTYDERSLQIAREMFFVMRQVKVNSE